MCRLDGFWSPRSFWSRAGCTGLLLRRYLEHGEHRSTFLWPSPPSTTRCSSTLHAKSRSAKAPVGHGCSATCCSSSASCSGSAGSASSALSGWHRHVPREKVAGDRSGYVGSPKRLQVAETRHHRHGSVWERFDGPLSGTVGVLVLPADDEGRSCNARKVIAVARSIRPSLELEQKHLG